MNTRILKLTSRNAFKTIILDFDIDEDFETLKTRYNNVFDGLTFRQAKKQIVKTAFLNENILFNYLGYLVSEYNIYNVILGKTCNVESTDLVKFVKTYIKTNFFN